MTENEMLASKSHSDLVEISVAFGDWSLEEAQSKTREELIEAITKTPLMKQSPLLRLQQRRREVQRKKPKKNLRARILFHLRKNLSLSRKRCQMLQK